MQAARKLQEDAVYHGVATVTAVGEQIQITSDYGDELALQAVSCLVAPVVGDTVEIARTLRGKTYVLAILEREAKVATSIQSEGDLNIRVNNGQCTVIADKGIEMMSPAAVGIASTSVNVHAKQGKITVGALSYLGSLVKAEVQKVKVFSEAIESVAEHVSQKVHRLYRVVEEFEQLRAGRIDYRAKDHIALHSENAVITAKKLVKVDGDQIHVG